MTTRLTLLCLSLLAVPLYAIPVAQTARSNETIEGDGPSGSPWWHNAQPSGPFQEYAVDSFLFTPANFGGAVTDIASVRISYMQSNAGFTADGPLAFFVSFDPTVGGGDYGGLAHSGSTHGIDDSQFSDTPSLQSLGTGNFVETADGDVDTYTLAFGEALASTLVSAINNSKPFSILMAAPSGGTAATYAGLESFDYSINGGEEPDGKRTNLSIDAVTGGGAVPEPATLLTVVVFGLGLALYRRRARN